MQPRVRFLYLHVVALICCLGLECYVLFHFLGKEWEREGKRKEHNGCACEKFLFLVVGPLKETLSRRLPSH